MQKSRRKNVRSAAALAMVRVTIPRRGWKLMFLRTWNVAERMTNAHTTV